MRVALPVRVCGIHMAWGVMSWSFVLRADPEKIGRVPLKIRFVVLYL